MQKVNLALKFSQFSELWSPKIVGELNGQLVKLVKVKGEFVWHHHQAEDELFLVVRGRLDMHLRDGVVPIHEGEFYIVPRGQLELRVNEALPDPTLRIVTYCEVGKISTLAAATLRRMGFTRAVALDGGMKAWKEKGYQTEATPQA